MRTSTQLKALIRNLSSKSNVEAEILLRNFMLERLLERIAISDFKHNFILKGGMLISAMVGVDTRTTMDMDTTIKDQKLSESEITRIIEDILKINIDDGAEFTFLSIEEIREEADYPGFRISIGAVFHKTLQRLKLDITTGDIVTPSEIEYDYKLMFENRSISIMAYNIETVLAEKIETIITRGITNTRMRDFYDVYILTNTFTYNESIFKTALKKTTEKRQTSQYFPDQTEGIINTIMKNETMTSLWAKYQSKYSYASGISWDSVIKAIKLLIAIASKDDK